MASYLARMLAAAAVALAGPAAADSAWQVPHVKRCTLEPGADCIVEARCPADRPYIVAGGGDLSEVSREDHRIAMTASLPASEHVWRVRWRNMGEGEPVQASAAVRVRCAENAAEAGW